MVFVYPELIKKGTKLEELDNLTLEYWHNQMHIFWRKIEEGAVIPDWDFWDIFDAHNKIIDLMEKKGLKHISPINSLDIVNIEGSRKEEKEEELKEFELKNISVNLSDAYSVEEKLNGFHAVIHKKGNEIKIFSEQKKELTKAFPTLIEEAKKLFENDFVIDGELVPYDEKGKILGRNELMKYVGAVKSGKQPDDSNIKFHIWDASYLGKNLTEEPLFKRIEMLSSLKFTDRMPAVQRKIVEGREKVFDAIKWASGIKGSEGAIIKDANADYSFGENSSWRKYRKLTPLVVSVLKVIPKKRNLFNYLVGVKADKKFLDNKYIEEGKLVLGHTFNTDKKFKVGDKIKILIEEIWRHEGRKGIHYSIHKPRVEDKTEENLSTIDYLEDIVASIGVSVTASEIEGISVYMSDALAEAEEPKDEGKEIEVKNFPDRMQENFKKMIGKWGDYAMHVHTRGKTLHYDIRHKIDNLLEGITLFGRSTADRLPIETKRNNIRSTIKMPQPIEWIKFQGVTERGGIGATKAFPGIFTIISKGKFTIHEVTDHKITIEYKSDKGKIDKKAIIFAKKKGFPIAGDLPDKMIDLTGKYSWHIAHIENRYIILFDLLKE